MLVKPRLAAFAAALILVVSPAVAKKAPPAPPPIKNIVLVHGAFADGSSWSKVITILQAKGFNVTAVQNPLSSLRLLQHFRQGPRTPRYSWEGLMNRERSRRKS